MDDILLSNAYFYIHIWTFFFSALILGEKVLQSCPGDVYSFIPSKILKIYYVSGARLIIEIPS